ncbi:tyrosine-type recombinase/integrase [Lysobacter firmicutimachus]|uniref:Tyrosine-type recombinase/integrase n=1 Tax=Lysobacter firmicutimachus TaxID=1792846 RepID=A0AAU8MXA3_9GAMM
MTAFAKLTRPAMRALEPGASINEHGIVYTKLKNGDGRWAVNVMVARTRHHQVIGLESEGYTRTQAEEVVAKLKAQKRAAVHGVAGSKQGAPRSIRAAAEDYLDYLAKHNGRDIETKRMRFKEHLTPHLGALSVARLSSDDWLAYVTTRKGEGAGPGTINRERSALLHMLNTMRRRRLLASVPDLQRQQEPKGKLVYLTPEEAAALLQAAAEDQSEHAHPFVMIALYSGARHEAVLGLRVRDVDPTRRILWVDKDKAGEREQPIPEVLAKYLSKLIAGREPDEFLFPSARAASGRVYQINSIFARCVQRAKLRKHVTPHTMRHTMATNAAHAGLDAATIQQMGGWKTRAMAERYTHAASMQVAMAALQTRLKTRRVTPKLHTRARGKR